MKHVNEKQEIETVRFLILKIVFNEIDNGECFKNNKKLLESEKEVTHPEQKKNI